MLTTWSRIVNFSYVLVLISFLLYSKISFKKYINPLSTIILFILLFDILILGLVFGNSKLVERYAETSIMGEAGRLALHKFGFTQFKEFWLFGYGAGAFGLIFKLFYNILPDGNLAAHAHNDGIELMGEVGIMGISILLLLSLIYFKKLLNKVNQERERARFILLSLLLIILFIQSFVDFSLHIPGIITLLILILSTGLVNYDKYKIVKKK